MSIFQDYVTSAAFRIDLSRPSRVVEAVEKKRAWLIEQAA